MRRCDGTLDWTTEGREEKVRQGGLEVVEYGSGVTATVEGLD